ncbi:MAG: ansB2, partial [Clostridia bacterium]|nr:ansB2 [Clostridia bacterium]
RSVGITTALCPYIGYQKAADVAKTSLKTGVSIKELILSENLLNKTQLEHILNPYAMTQPPHYENSKTFVI